MAHTKAMINKDTLSFLLSKKGVTSEYLSRKSSYTVEQIKEWIDKNSDKFPTLNQARKIAEILRVPFAGLYMTVETITPLIPERPDVQNRRVMDAISGDDSAVNLAITDLLQARDFYIETETMLDRTVVSFSTQFNSVEGVKAWANKIRSEFAISLDRQYRAPSTRQFYLYLKNRIEEKGIFIQEFSDVDTSTLRAMAVYQNKTMPIIGINENDRPPAKSFSLIHELVHIIKRTSSICNAMYNNSFLQNQEEIFCNAVAGETLVPIEALKVIIDNSTYNLIHLTDIQKISEKFSVSREVIIRRILDSNYINQSQYDTLLTLLQDEVAATKEEQKRQKEAGIKQDFFQSPARKAMDKTSLALSKAIYAGYSEDVFSKYDVSQILSIKTKHVDKYFEEVAKWNS